MARIIPQAQPDPFAPQVAGLYGTRDRPSTKFQTVNRFLDTAKAVADSPLTGLAMRGIQAGAGGISDMLSAAAARRMEEYKAGGLEGELSPDIAAPEPYKPMKGLSLRGDQPEGLGLSLRDMPEQEPAQGWSSESRMGELQDTLGADLARAAQRKLGVEPVDARQSALGKGILPAFTSPRVPGLEMDPDAARLDAAIAESPRPRPRPVGASAVKQSLIDNTVMGAFVSPRVPGLEMDPDAVRLTRPPQRPAGPSAPMLPQPRVPRMAESEPLPTAEQLGERRRNPPLTLDFEGEPEAQPPRPPIATQTEDDTAREQQMRDNAWRKFVEGDDAEPTDTGPTLKEDLRLKAPGLRDLKPDVDLEDVTVPSGGLEGVAEAAPVLGRSGRLAAATDEQLNNIRDSLQGDDPETQRRIAQIDRELQQRSDVTRVAERALTPEELIKRARMAGTAEEQAQVLADSARVRLPITSVADLIGDGREKAFRQELLGVFPAAPKKTAEQIAADIALLEAKAQERRDAAALAAARARGEDVRAPAVAEKDLSMGARALAQGQTEDYKQKALLARAGYDSERAKELADTRKNRMGRVGAEANRAQAAADKFKAEMDQIRAKMVAVRRGGGGGGGDIYKQIKALKTVQDAQDDAVKQANDLTKEAMTSEREALKAANAARTALSKIGAPGKAPRDPATVERNADPQVKREVEDNYDKWQARTGAYEQARQDLLEAEADAKAARDALDRQNTIRATAQENAKEYDAIKRELRVKIEGKLGAKPGAAPATAPAGAAQEGSEYTSDGKTYQIRGGKPVRIK